MPISLYWSLAEKPLSFCQGKLGVLIGDFHLSYSHAHKPLISCCI